MKNANLLTKNNKLCEFQYKGRPVDDGCIYNMPDLVAEKSLTNGKEQSAQILLSNYRKLYYDLVADCPIIELWDDLWLLVALEESTTLIN